MVCYADDTHRGDGQGLGEARGAAEKKGAMKVLRDIRDIGLAINTEKAEATWLGLGARDRPPREERVTMVDGRGIAIGPRL